jgi:WXG100 family type VII secretion target
MAGGYKAEIEAFQKAYADVTDIKGSMDQNLSTLRSNIEATQAGWQGEAAKAFQNVMMAFDEKTLKLNQALEGIADLIQQAGQKYGATEDDTNQAVASLGSSVESSGGLGI